MKYLLLLLVFPIIAASDCRAKKKKQTTENRETMKDSIPVCLRKMIDEKGLKVLIEIDGGVTLENAGTIVAAGADVLVAGNTVFSSSDPKATIAQLKKL